MRTDALAAVLRPLRGYVARIAARADHDARSAGLTVEAGPGGVRRYRDPRMDRLAGRQALGPYTAVRAEAEPTVTAWSTPTLTVSASLADLAGAGWSR